MTKKRRLMMKPTNLVRMSHQRGHLRVPITPQTLTKARLIGAVQARLTTNSALHDGAPPRAAQPFAPRRRSPGHFGPIAAILSP